MLSSIWDLQLHLISHSFHPARDAFTFSVETYAQWVWLALEEGRFGFGLGQNPSAQEAECFGGAWVLCPPGEPLRRQIRQTASYHFMRFEIEGDDSALRALRGLGSLRDGQRTRANFAALRAASGARSGEWKAHLLLDFLRAAWHEKSQTIPKTRDREMEKVRAILETQFAQKISLEILARQSRLSPPAFSRRFRAALGVSPQEFLMQTRLHHAQNLLLQTNFTLDNIAAQCGLANGFYLSRLWTKRFGIAPARFRRLHRV